MPVLRLCMCAHNLSGQGDEEVEKCWTFVLVYFVSCDCSCAITKRKDMEKLSVDQVCYQLNRNGIDKASIKVIRGK